MTHSLALVHRYALHSVFKTVQGEGVHAGRLAIFCRFSGCSVWSGREEHRERDAMKNSACARVCDTKFVGHHGRLRGALYTAEELHETILELWGTDTDVNPRVVLTGGEPMLQVDQALVDRLRLFHLAIETNGTKRVPSGIRWVTVSPKPPMPLVEQHYDEVKVLSIYDPLPFEGLSRNRWYVPCTDPSDGPGSPRYHEEVEKCLEFVKNHPQWRLGFQAQNQWGIP